jgi:hypothetical protein
MSPMKTVVLEIKTKVKLTGAGDKVDSKTNCGTAQCFRTQCITQEKPSQK